MGNNCILYDFSWYRRYWEWCYDIIRLKSPPCSWHAMWQGMGVFPCCLLIGQVRHDRTLQSIGDLHAYDTPTIVHFWRAKSMLAKVNHPCSPNSRHSNSSQLIWAASENKVFQVGQWVSSSLCMLMHLEWTGGYISFVWFRDLVWMINGMAILQWCA